MRSPPRGYMQSVEIAQSPARVFKACTEPLLLTRWYATEASVEPHAGGTFRVRLKDGRVRDAAIDIWEPGRRLRLIYMNDPELPAGGPIVEDLMFDIKGTATVLRVLGSGVPGGREWDTEFLRLRRGWAYWLDNLKQLLEHPPLRPVPR
ncbi:MAG: SRPBCC domain-containing protein [Deltaproteobacteria bacterium]